LVLRRNLISVTSLADTYKTEFVILWILSVYCSTTLRRYGNYIAALLDTLPIMRTLWDQTG